MKRAFFVIGPEGSGTYMLAEAFVSAGCTYCDKDDVEAFLSEQQPNLLVLRRSLPHAGEWPSMELIERHLKRTGYSVALLAIIRDSLACLKSVTKRKGSFDSRIFGQALERLGFYLEKEGRLISYEYFTSSIQYRQEIFNSLGLVSPREMEFYDGNAKYYE